MEIWAWLVVIAFAIAHISLMGYFWNKHLHNTGVKTNPANVGLAVSLWLIFGFVADVLFMGIVAGVHDLILLIGVPVIHTAVYMVVIHNADSIGKWINKVLPYDQ